MSYYLKYRPQTVGTLDLVSVRAAFERILKTGQFAQAYLFAGPKGTGKTSSARILAKILNCEKNKEALPKHQPLVEPCGVCAGCVSVQRGTNLSVMEMDAASNRGIDDIRLLRERIGLAPVSGLYNVYVIDEVHMLTTEAFNALLKTLEEPPEHVVFVLATTDPHKIPETVLSRCTFIPFSQATGEEIKHALMKAVSGEQLTVAETVLDSLALRSGGSFRDALKLLEQATQEAKEITQVMVDRLTGFDQGYDPHGLLTCLHDKDALGALTIIKEKITAGVDFSVWGTRVVEQVRQQLIDQATNQTSDRENINDMAALAGRLSRAVVEMKTAVVPSLPLEIAVVKWCLQDKHEARSTKSETVEQKHTMVEAKNPELNKETELQKEGQGETQPKFEGKPINIEEIKEKWAEVMRAVKPLNHSLEALLRAAKPHSTKDDWLVIEVAYAFHKEQLEQERYRRMVEQKMTEVIGKPVKIKLILGQKAATAVKKLPTVMNVTGKVADEALAQAAEEIFS